MRICIWPDGEWCLLEELTEMSHRSDDYEVREGAVCRTCFGIIVPHYGEPFADCECGTQEWYK